MSILIAFTGHRPKDLAGATYSQFASALDALKMNTRSDVEFITGGAVGVDTWAAEYAISRGIQFHLALPFTPQVQSNRWPQFAKDTLLTHVAAAKTVTILSQGGYDVEMLQRRNVHMVDMAEHVLAVWTGKLDGGTANCIRYAVAKGKPVYNLWPLEGKLRPVKSIAPKPQKGLVGAHECAPPDGALAFATFICGTCWKPLPASV